MATHTGESFADIEGMNFEGDTFDGCSFSGTARYCNLAIATFEGCTFAEGFSFQSCLMVGTSGVESVPKVGCNYLTLDEFARKMSRPGVWPERG